jgi:transposase
MRKIREVLRLKAEGLSERKIAASLGIGHSGAGDTIRRAGRAGLSWPLPDDLTDELLEQRLFPAPQAGKAKVRPHPDWAHIHRERRRPGVTLMLLWEEYRAVHPDGLGRTQFCEHYRRWKAKLSPTMRQTHVAGEKMFVDYAGQTIEIMDPLTGELREAQLFVACLGASSYTFAEATMTQNLTDWTGSHCRAFSFFGGVTAQIVSDNLKSGITKACFYEPAVNRTYSDLARHYRTAVVPARPYKPRDKAKVESAVQLAERWILAALRNRQFFSLSELNAEIRELLVKLNTRVTRHLGNSRRALYEEFDKPKLKALSQEPFEYAEWKKCKAGLDYHVEIDKHYYSVPHKLIRQELWARFTARTVEIFHRAKRVASHMRGPANKRHTTLRNHMPSAHRHYADWTPERVKRQAAKVGPSAEALVDIIMCHKPHPEQGFRACIGILRLGNAFGSDRLEAACGRAIDIGARSYTSVNSILKNNLDRKRPEPATDGPAITHPNIRGAAYYH